MLSRLCDIKIQIICVCFTILNIFNLDKISEVNYNDDGIKEEEEEEEEEEVVVEEEEEEFCRNTKGGKGERSKENKNTVSVTKDATKQLIPDEICMKRKKLGNSTVPKSDEDAPRNLAFFTKIFYEVAKSITESCS